MKTHPEEQTTLIVHPGTGTIIKADECVLINTDDTAIWPEDHELIETAEANGDTLDDLHVVVVGNVFDACIDIVGPFLSLEDAMDWGEREADQEWWASSITSAAKAVA
jgi:hypothetical protein